MEQVIDTNKGKRGGLLVGNSHKKGGIGVIVTDTGQNVEVEGGEVIINKYASKKHWKELSRINQSAGNGVPILPPSDFSDKIEYGLGGNFSISDLQEGTKIEMEHASTINEFKKSSIPIEAVARKIAKDHLKENANYYKIIKALKLAQGGEVVCRSCSNKWKPNLRYEKTLVCKNCKSNQEKYYAIETTQPVPQRNNKQRVLKSEKQKLSQDWDNLVNMDSNEMRDFQKGNNKNSTVNFEEADIFCVEKGRLASKWIMEMNEIDKSNWNANHWTWAKKITETIPNLLKIDSSEEIKSKVLKVWGHDIDNTEREYEHGGGIGGTSDTAEDLSAPVLGGTMTSSMALGGTFSNSKELSVALRLYVKEKYPNCKFSITTPDSSLKIKLVSADFNPFSEQGSEYKEKGYMQVNEYGVKNNENLSEKGKSLFIDIVNFVSPSIKNYNADDPYADYVSYNIYTNYRIGDWDTPFTETASKNKSVKKGGTPFPKLPDGLKPKFAVGEKIKYKIVGGFKDGVIKSFKYVPLKDQIIYYVTTPTKILNIWETNIFKADYSPTPDLPNKEEEKIELIDLDYIQFSSAYNPDIKKRFWNEIKEDWIKFYSWEKFQNALKSVEDILDDDNETVITIVWKNKKFLTYYIRFGKSFFNPFLVKFNDYIRNKYNDISNSSTVKATDREFLSWEDESEDYIITPADISLANMVYGKELVYVDGKISVVNSLSDINPKYDDGKKYYYFRTTDLESGIKGYITIDEENLIYLSENKPYNEELLWNHRVVKPIPKEDDKLEEPKLPEPLPIEPPKNLFNIGQIVSIKGQPKNKYLIKSFEKEESGLIIYEGEYTETGDLFSLVENTLELALEDPKLPEPKRVEKEEDKELSETIKTLEAEKDSYVTLYKMLSDYEEGSQEVRKSISATNGVINTFKSDEYDIDKALNTYFKNAVSTVNYEDNDEKQSVIKLQTKSKEFKQWFGDFTNDDDLSSFVVDKNGDPLVVYHGTTNSFEFSRFQFGKFPIMYFAKNRSYAEWFAKLGNGIIYECFLDIKFMVDFRNFGTKDVSWSEITTHLKTKYGIEINTSNNGEKQKVWQYIRQDYNKMLSVILEAGYDGIAHVENNPNDIVSGKENVTDAFMTYYPEQTKAVKYVSQLTPFNQIMTMAKGGSIAKKKLLSKIKNLSL